MEPLRRYEDRVAALAAIADEDRRLEYIIDLARRRRAEPFPSAWRKDANLMHGCMAKVWIVHRVAGDRHHFRGRSDAMIVDGLVAIMTESFSGLTGEALEALTLDHVRRFRLGALTAQRQVGMMAMLRHFQKLARGSRLGDDGKVSAGPISSA